MQKSTLTKNQKIKLPTREFYYYGEPCKIFPIIRYDDECNNGHNTFAITCDIRNSRGIWIAGGCCHEEFAQAYPEYAHLIKWHLCSSDEPLYYIANTLYHASNSKDTRYKAGEPNRWAKVLKFNRSFITHKLSENFLNFLENNKNLQFEVVEVQHEPTTDYQYSPKYTFKGFDCRWYECPFDTQEKATEFSKELSSKKWKILTIVTGYQEAKERDFAAARSSAIWEEATEEELSLPSEELKKLLLKRLPKLMKDFKKDIESLGFIY